MSGVTFSGLATGLDTASIVTQLVELKRQPIYRLQRRRQLFEAQKTALTTFKDKLTKLQDAAKALDTASEFSSLKASTNDEDLLKVTAGDDASAGTYTINVTELATAQKEQSQGFDSKITTVGSGTVSFTVDGETTDLELVGFNSLEGLATKINNDVAGVSASIIYDGSETGGYFLSLSSEEAGSANAFTADFSGLSGGTTPVMTQTQAALDAQLTVDNIPVTTTSNSTTEVISGLTLDLLAVGETTVTVERDVEGISDKVKEMVDAYNDVFAFVKDQTGSEGTLRDNPTLRTVANQIENVFTSELSGGLGDFTRFYQVGISRGDARQVEFDAEEFAEALDSDFGSVRDLFIEREGNLGKMYLVEQSIDDMTDSISGLFKSGFTALDTKIENADNSIDRYERSVESYRMTMTRRFTAMEQMVSQLQAQGNYLTSVMYQQG